jgi:hypothetical protein
MPMAVNALALKYEILTFLQAWHSNGYADFDNLNVHKF